MLMTENEETLKEFPFHFEFRVFFELTDNILNVRYEVTNTDTKTLICAFGGHPGINIPFGDGEFECDVTQLYPGSIVDEDGYLITKDGEKIDLTDVDVNVEVGLKDITISDNDEEGGAVGNIVSMIYKGDHYQIIVRTDENEEDFVFDTEDTWNENDRVSVIIPKSKIKLSLKQEIKR